MKKTDWQGRDMALDGVGVSPGIAIGPAYVFDRGQIRVPEYHIGAPLIDAEVARFDGAVDLVRRALEELREKSLRLSGAAEEELGYLLEAHLHMLADSRLVRSVRAIIRTEKINAEAAIQIAIGQIAHDFAKITDSYLAARMDDIREVGRRLILALTSQERGDFRHAPKGAVLIGEAVSPADVALMQRGHIAGLVGGQGGAEGHTAIMARARGLPTVLGVDALSRHVETGVTVIVDGGAGLVIVDPDSRTVKRYETLRLEQQEERRKLNLLASEKAITEDGAEVNLYANIELPLEIPMAIEAGAAGIGLMRSEFLFMNRDDLPGEEEQYQAFREMVEAMRGKPITIRTLDAGADKMAGTLKDDFKPSENPALGLRGIRFTLWQRGIMETQFAAILRAAKYGPTRILLPMVTTAEEVRQARAIMLRTVRTLIRRGKQVPDPLPPIGAMIEVPAAALCADVLAREVDFLSIGTNDLTMYTLAADRGNEQVADLYNSMHPALLRLIKFTTDAAAKAKIPVHLCGEMAGDPRMTAALLGLGLRDLSATPLALPAVKQRIRNLNMADCQRKADQLLC